MLISVLVFEGGASVSEDDEVSISEWSREELIRVINEFMGPVVDAAGNEIAWEDDVTIECFDPAENGKRLGDTLEIVNDNFAQAVKCAVDGGMMYIVRSA